MSHDPEIIVESDPPFGRRQRDWTLLIRGLKIFFVTCGLALLTLIGYSAHTYIKEVAAQQVTDSLATLNTLTSKVQSLDEFKVREERQTADTQAQVNLILIKMSAVEVMQAENNKNTERILNQILKANHDK